MNSGRRHQDKSLSGSWVRLRRGLRVLHGAGPLFSWWSSTEPGRASLVVQPARRVIEPHRLREL